MHVEEKKEREREADRQMNTFLTRHKVYVIDFCFCPLTFSRKKHPGNLANSLSFSD